MTTKAFFLGCWWEYGSEIILPKSERLDINHTLGEFDPEKWLLEESDPIPIKIVDDDE